jgi:type I restriction enzyme, S subunit
LFPKLRFKEFDGDWLKLKYKDVLTIKYGKDHKSLNDGDIPVLGTGGIMRYVDSYLYDGESILIGRKGTIDKPQYINEKFWTVDTLFYTEIKENIVPLFLFQHALEVNWLGLNEATGVPSLNTTSIYNVDISIPSKEEQTKIVTFLSAIDEKISQFNQKHELLSQYKQGMMQKLFSQQIRFKADDGSEFAEWKELKFKDVIKIKYGKDHKKLDDGDIPVLGTGGIMRYVNSYLYDGESILIGRKGTIDKPRFISGKFWTVDTLFYTEIGEKILPKFAFQQLLLVNWLNLNEATGVPSLNTTSIGNIELKVPCLAEQTKIASVLSAIDQKIEVVSKQIEQAKQWKKGLLQQMFI